jgi:putative ABC transport system ATP-binding protein
MSSGDPVIAIHGVVKKYEKGLIPALNGADLSVDRGEWIAIVGKSGCGKSTLLHLIGALDQPDAGTIRVNGRDLASEHDLNHYRSREVGLVFQMHNLLMTLTASENVQIPLFEMGLPARERRARADRMLDLVGLAGKETHRPTELSGGERQRVAVARALVTQPAILLADEPTGSLDSSAGHRVLALLEEIRGNTGLTIVMVTHDPDVAEHANRIVRMHDGRVVGAEPSPRAAGTGSPTPEARTG